MTETDRFIYIAADHFDSELTGLLVQFTNLNTGEIYYATSCSFYVSATGMRKRILYDGSERSLGIISSAISLSNNKWTESQGWVKPQIGSFNNEKGYWYIRDKIS